ncbi:MAG: hypothetical protein ABI718_02730 [Acidobacteriota bacterium]
MTRATLLLACLMAFESTTRASSLVEAVMAWAPASNVLIVAHGGPRPTVTAYSMKGAILWSRPGLAHPSFVVTDKIGSRVAILSALDDAVQIVELNSGGSRRVETPATPVAARFEESAVVVLCRDGRKLVRIADGTISMSVDLPADASFLAGAGGSLWIYSRLTGDLIEFDSDTLSIRSRAVFDRFASDLEVDDRHAYLVYPREGTVEVIALPEMTLAGRLNVGAVPIDLIVQKGGTALTATVLHVADPASRAIYANESTQSFAAAFGRGLLRGLLGFGLLSGTSAQFPAPIDRILADGNRMLAYDSAGRALYSFGGKKSHLLATSVPRGGYTFVEQGIAWWDETGNRPVIIPSP